MARPPDVKTFNKWFLQTEKETLPLLTKDFASGRLKDTLVFKSYRKGAKLIKTDKPAPTPKNKPIATDSVECISAPIDLATVLNSIEQDNCVEANVKVDLNDLIECGSDLHLKELLAELLIGSVEFKDLDSAIDYTLIGGDCDGIYFNVKCYDTPVTESAD